VAGLNHDRMNRRLGRPLMSRLLGAMASLVCTALEGQTLPGTDIAELSIDELANLRVISVSRRSQPISDAAASVYVITAEAIRRSGASSLFEAMRLAPNLQVGSDNGVPGFVSARGSNAGVYASPNKMLMLIDGRSSYSQWFAGIFWDVQDVMLEDVDRIEVISGPAGTLWGINAVNGVINVITKTAAETTGGLASLTWGTNGATATFRQGGKLGEDGNFRVYGKYFDRKHHQNELTGMAVDDDWHNSQLGFRADWDRGSDQVAVQGNVFQGSEGQAQPGLLSGTGAELQRIAISGANLSARWSHRLADNGAFSIQAYLDHAERRIRPVSAQNIDVADIEFQHQLPTLGRHAITWGMNGRHSWDRITNTEYFLFLPASVQQNWASLFVQDEIVLSDTLKATIGARAERNPYSGTEFLPSARLSWKVTPDQLLWTAVSRTLRAPTRLDADIAVPGSPPFFYVGNSNPRSEVAKVVELGYRGRVGSKINLSATAFHNQYTDLATIDFPEDGPPQFGNGMKGWATGIEMWASWQATPRWRLNGGFTALREKFSVTSPLVFPGEAGITGNDPAATWQIRSSYNVSENREIDFTVRHVGTQAGIDSSNPGTPSYTAIDARFGWKIRPDLEFSITGLNLFGTGHAEFGLPEFRATFDREIMAKVVWRF
ncbi:MAG: TonB-dependent receptor plug domain-containing protein, partial [Janthinobacterium lividum]